MHEDSNSVVYDATTEELTVTTYYKKEQYLDTNLRRAYYLETKYILTSKEPEVKKHRARRIYHVWRILLLLTAIWYTLFLLLQLFYTYKTRIIYYILAAFAWVIVFCISQLKLRFTEWELQHHWYEKRRQIKPTWKIIEQEFSVSPIFRQTVTITPTGYTVTSPFPACPSFTVQREGKGFVKLLPDGHNLYLFHKREKKRRAYYRGHAYRQEGSAYFLRENYSTKDWSLLVAKLQEWKYI